MIRARVYRNKKDEARVQITMELDEAKDLADGKLEKQVSEVVKAAIAPVK